MAKATRWTLIGAVVAAALAAVVLVATGDSSWMGSEQLVRGVSVKQGKLAGLAESTETGLQYLAFRGIPYARPPVGSLRFQAPLEAEPWDGEFLATRDGASCMQVRATRFKYYGLLGRGAGWQEMLLLLTSSPFLVRHFFSLRESEDCLFLNVFTPVTELPAAKLRPVLVFIYGGGFVRGNSNTATYAPDYLLERDMVVVSFNYRLGTFGFLSTETPDAPGNAGLKDQVLALKWVRDNIRSFGGDPDRVTIYGESAGAASVHFHVLSPMSRGLFHSAIMSSSAATSGYVMNDKTEEHSQRLGRLLGAAEDVVKDPRRLVDFLRTKSSAEISAKFIDSMMPEDTSQLFTKMSFGPVVEKCDDGQEHMLCEAPEDLLVQGRFNKVPMILGLNAYEGTLIFALDSAEEVREKIQKDVTAILPKRLFSEMSGEQRESVARRVQQHYIRTESDNDTVVPLVHLYGDVIMTHGFHLAMKWHRAHSAPATPVHIYHYTNNAFGFYKLLHGVNSLDGPGHADELSCVFKLKFLNERYLPNKPQVLEARERMMGIMSQFVHGKYDGEPWPPFTKGDTFLEFGDTFKIKTDLNKDRMQLWDEVYSEVTQHPVYK